MPAKILGSSRLAHLGYGFVRGENAKGGCHAESCSNYVLPIRITQRRALLVGAECSRSPSTEYAAVAESHDWQPSIDRADGYRRRNSPAASHRRESAAADRNPSRRRKDGRTDAGVKGLSRQERPRCDVSRRHQEGGGNRKAGSQREIKNEAIVLNRIATGCPLLKSIGRRERVFVCEIPKAKSYLQTHPKKRKRHPEVTGRRLYFARAAYSAPCFIRMPKNERYTNVNETKKNAIASTIVSVDGAPPGFRLSANSTASSPNKVVNLITGFRATDDVSLNGSPTVSPITVASCSGVPFCFSSTSTIFLALSQAAPALAMKIAWYNPKIAIEIR